MTQIDPLVLQAALHFSEAKHRRHHFHLELSETAVRFYRLRRSKWVERFLYAIVWTQLLLGVFERGDKSVDFIPDIFECVCLVLLLLELFSQLFYLTLKTFASRVLNWVQLVAILSQYFLMVSSNPAQLGFLKGFRVVPLFYLNKGVRSVLWTMLRTVPSAFPILILIYLTIIVFWFVFFFSKTLSSFLAVSFCGPPFLDCMPKTPLSQWMIRGFLTVIPMGCGISMSWSPLAIPLVCSFSSPPPQTSTLIVFLQILFCRATRDIRRC